MNIGDIVARKSYRYDIWFKIIDIIGENVILQGLYYRLVADAHISDIEKVSTRDGNINEEDREDSISKIFKTWYTNQCGFKNYAEDDFSLSYKKFGKILHIDGDKTYLKESISKYKKLGVPVVGVSIEESIQPQAILDLLKLHKPNVLVITGHDSVTKGDCDLNNIDNYKNSKYYVESVRIAREYNNSYDDLVIFAGGCKSHYEAIMDAGANFASSPNRILIHVIDPVLIASKIATTSVREILDIDTIIKNTSVGLNGIGGLETRGQSRECKPKF